MELRYVVKDIIDIKRIVREKLSISERLYKKIKHDYIFVNGTKIDYKTILSLGDIVTINLDFDEDNSNIVPNYDIPLTILYEDEWLLIIDKPAGIPVHPAINHYTDSLSNSVKAYYDKNNIHKKIRPVNRLDKDTSGIVIFAKSEYIQENLKNYHKEYLAIVYGKLQGLGTIDAPIARKDNSIIERCIDKENGVRAITHYEALKNIDIQNNSITLIKCILETGRTHQIRVHLSYIGHPLVGDSLYNDKINSDIISRQALHAYKISFIHPVTRENFKIVCNLPEDMEKIIL